MTSVGPRAFHRRAPAALACLAAAAAAAGCTPRPEPPRPALCPSVPGMQGMSLLGTPLVPAPIDEQARSRLEADLARAEAAYRADPDCEEATIWYGRRLAYLQRYGEAIDVYTRGLERHPGSAALLRHRGHRYITLRRFDEAIADLRRAAALVDGRPDAVEPDGAPNERNIPRGTLQTAIWYHLGLAQYLKGDFDAAAASFGRRASLEGTNDDNLVSTSYWRYLSLRRLGRDADAATVLDAIRPGMDVIENHNYYQMLLVFKAGGPGEKDLEAAGAAGPARLAGAGYGVGAWRLVNGDAEGAARVFRRVIETGQWAQFGYIAAEAELARGR